MAEVQLYSYFTITYLCCLSNTVTSEIGFRPKRNFLLLLARCFWVTLTLIWLVPLNPDNIVLALDLYLTGYYKSHPHVAKHHPTYPVI
jgi:hypothetical protein